MNYSKNANTRMTNQNKRRRRKTKKNVGALIIKFAMIVVIIGCFAGAGAVLGAYMGVIEKTPDINIADVVPDKYTSIIYDANGNEIDTLHSKENRQYAKLEDIPKNLQNAVLAIEDERFYSHNGIDMRGMARAVIENIKTWSFAQGASTITQQLIKNEKLSSEKKLSRKIIEQNLAVTLEKKLTETLGTKEKAKNYILELYLNTIPLNHGLNGVQSAAKFYFGKEVSELSLSECAAIAGITKNPSKYSPISFPEENKKRRETVLYKMLELNYITKAEYDEAVADDITPRLVGQLHEEGDLPSTHSYFVDAVVFELANQLMNVKGMTKQQAYDAIYSGGLQIYTTQDMTIQDILDRAIADDSLYPPSGNGYIATYAISVLDKATNEQVHYTRTADVNNSGEADNFVQNVKNEILNDNVTLVADNLSLKRGIQAAMVIMDQYTGQVKALSGGREKNGDLVFNRATQAYRQPGSCFKVLASYAPGIDLGVLYPGTVIMDEPYSYNGRPINNWWGGYRGPYTVRNAIRDSANIIAAKAMEMVGFDNSFDYLQKFGFKELVDNEVINGQVFSDKNPSTALGGITKGVSPLELTAAYAAIANGGVYNEPILFTRVLDHNGNVLLENNSTQNRILKETTAYLLTNCMEEVIRGGGSATGRLAAFDGMSIAGKTGTTTDDKDLAFAGYTPYYTAGIWMGYDQPKRMSYDKSYHLLIWKRAMSELHQNLENKSFVQPAGITSRTICSVSGLSPQEGVCGNDYYGSYVRSELCSTDFITSNGVCDVHRSFTVDLSTGKIANEFCPSDSVRTVVLAVSEDENGYLTILNKPSSEALTQRGLVDIDLNHVCNEHDEMSHIVPEVPQTPSTPMTYDPVTGELVPLTNNNDTPIENVPTPDNGTPTLPSLQNNSDNGSGGEDPGSVTIIPGEDD